MNELTSGEFCAALEREDIEAIRTVPKADLHNHGLLGGRLSSYRQWARCELPEPPAVFADFTDFDHYILVQLAVPYKDCPVERVREFFRFFFAETLKEAIADGVVLIEPSLDCSFLGLYNDDPAAMVEDFQRVIDSVLEAAGNPPLDIRPELGMARGVPLDLLERNIPRALKTGFFKSIDLYGDERTGGIAEYIPFFRMAGEMGLRKKAHSGELCGAEHIRESVEFLDLDAVQHGIAAAGHPETLAFLSRRGTTLNVCPSSNIRLARAPSLAAHPVRKLFDAGITVTINTDDRMVFDSSVSDEFLKLKQAGVFTSRELDRIRLNGLSG